MSETAPSPLAVHRRDTTETKLKNTDSDLETAVAVPPDSERGVRWFVLIFSAIIILIVALKHPAGLKFEDNLINVLPGALGALLLVSAFIERIIEVVVSIWSDPGAAPHEQQIDYWLSRKFRLAQEVEELRADHTAAADATVKAAILTKIDAKKTAIEEAVEAVDIHEKALIPFKAATRRRATWIGVAVGIFAASTGFRLFHQLVKLPASPEQTGWFYVGDTVLTGFVLGGGTKLIHSALSVYTSFMASARKKVETSR